MNPYTGINLPPPSPATRQVGTGSLGSPVSIARSTSSLSTASEIRSPEETLRDYLNVYKTFLEHEIQFVDNEILALIERPPSDNPAQDGALLTLRDNLKVRYNSLRSRLTRVISLLEVM
jgi:hypothetical protein